MPGFRGAFIGVASDVLGNLEDNRPFKHRPSFDSLSTLPTKTLQGLWRTALLNQKKALIEAEGEAGNELVKVLNEEIASVDTLDCERCDSKFKSRSAPIASSSSSSSAAAVGAAESKED